MSEALVIIDVQNDYFDGGAFPLFQPENALANICLLANKFTRASQPLYVIQHISRSKGADFFLPATHGVDIHSLLNPFLSSRNAYVIEKAYPNSFLQTTLQEKLQQQKIDQLVICGMMTHLCVDSTTRQAKELNYKVKLIADACATRDLFLGRKKIAAAEVQNAFLAALSNFSEIKTTKAYLA